MTNAATYEVLATIRPLVNGQPVHGGEQAVCVRIDSGHEAWGRAPEMEVAEARAVAAAHELAAASYQRG